MEETASIEDPRLINAFSTSWNKSLAYDRGWYMGGEYRTKGVQVALGPVVGPVGRVITGGRNWECEYPLMNGRISKQDTK